MKNVHLNGYMSAMGNKELCNILGKNVIVGNGSKELLFICQTAFSKLYKNGVIVYITPYWVSYIEQAKIIGIDIFTIQVESDMKLNPKKLEDTLKTLNGINKKTMLVFNNPCNPTGCIYNKTEVKKIADICKKYDTVVLSDSIYSKLVHTKKEHEFGKIEDFYPSGTIVSDSLSKTFGCGGYRFGWIVVPDELTLMFKIMNCLASSIYSCPTTFLQYVAIEVLKMPEDIKKLIKFQKNMFETIGNDCYKELTDMNIKCSVPDAAWYLWLDFTKHKTGINNLNIYTSIELTNYLVDNLNIIMVPGVAFGMDGLFARYAYVDINVDIVKETYNYDKIKECMNILKKWVESL